MPENDSASAGELRKIANILALLYTKELAGGERIRVLDAIGFDKVEIAALTGIAPGSVQKALYRQRKRGEQDIES